MSARSPAPAPAPKTERNPAHGKAVTPQELIAYADADDASEKCHSLVYSPLGSVNMMNMGADDDVGSFACGEGGEAHFGVDEALAFADTRLVAILSNDHDKYDAYSDWSSRLRGIYDVLRQRLYLKKEVNCKAVGLVWSCIGSNWTNKEMDASVLCLDMTAEEASWYSALTDVDVHDMQMLVRRLVVDDAAAVEKAKHRGIWIHHLRKLMEQGRRLNNPTVIAEEVARLQAILEAGSSAYPGAVEEAYTEAYASAELLPSLATPHRLPLFRLHLGNGALQHSGACELDSLRLKLDSSKAKYADARVLFAENERSHTAWLTSRRCAWVSACLRGGLAEDEGEEGTSAAKVLRADAC